MPRKARLDAPGALHHIIVRGINKFAIFEDRQDRTRFLERLGHEVTEAHASVYAWTIMDTHVHILFKSGKRGISAVMRKLLTWYAQYYNRRHGRTGHLFENRYKSILCDEDHYLLELIRYIHLNPVRAGVIRTFRELDFYPWSGHSTIMGKTQQDWMDIGFVLRQFSRGENAARMAYRSFVEEGMGMGRIPELTGGGFIRSKGGWSQVLSARRKGEEERGDERILGDGDFVDRILKDAEEKALRQLRFRRERKNITRIIEEECAREQVSMEEVKGGSRRKKVCDLRAVIGKRGLDELGLPLAEIARHVGVSTSGIARAIARLEREKGRSEH